MDKDRFDTPVAQPDIPNKKAAENSKIPSRPGSKMKRVLVFSISPPKKVTAYVWEYPI